MKRKNNYKELEQLQKIKRENDKLKKENSRLRKILSRFENFDHVKDVLEEDQSERLKETQMVLEDLKKAWACKECKEGYLEIIIFGKMGESWYFRKCNNCSNRTKSQKYDPAEVKGIKSPTT